MSLITIISITLIVLATTDFMFPNMPRLKNDIFKVSFLLTYFLFTIKYYYGPDIYFYIPHYENIPSISYIITHPSEIRFELGYSLFCSFLKSLGCSFWVMTAVISTIYFVAIYSLFQQLETKKTFALMILIIIDNALIYAAIRQCLSVALFIFMILAIQKQKYIETAICALLTIMFHKSGIFVVIPTLLYLLIPKYIIKQYSFQILLFLLCTLLFFPLVKLINPLINILPLSERVLNSIEHHLLLGRTIQVIFLVYLVAIICLTYFTKNKTDKITAIKHTALIGLILIVCLYQYFYILNRIRSYFLPFIIIYVINSAHNYFKNKDLLPYSTLIKQLSILFLFIYASYFTYSTEKAYSKTISQIHDKSTIFDLRYNDKTTIRDRQFKKAQTYWEEDFFKDTNNLIKNSND